MRKSNFVVGEYYHVYNRGTDKRDIFSSPNDILRFMDSILNFNQSEPIGSMYEFSFVKKQKNFKYQKPIVKFVAYCLNPNHFHFLISPLIDGGIEKFMQRIGNGYTKYFNNKYKRSGVLFQGKFKSKLVDSNEYLLHLSVYINKNTQLGHRMSKLSKSSMEEYEKDIKGICDKEIILDQFKTKKEYLNYAEDVLKDILIRKDMQKELEQ